VGALCSRAYAQWPGNWQVETNASSSEACAQWKAVAAPFPGYECAMLRANGSVVCRELDDRYRTYIFECKDP
jgi:hypothetical protein